MKRMKGKLLAALMSLAMVFTMMPMMGTSVYADDPAPPAPGIALGPDVLSIGSNTSGAATVHMAGTKWRVIGYGVSQEGGIPQVASSADTMTLIAADNLKTDVQFRAAWQTGGDHNYGQNTNNEDSNLKTEIEKLTGTGTGKIFSKEEKEGIVPRDLEPGDYTNQAPYTNGIAGAKVTGALLWPLSTQEAYYMDGNLRNVVAYWWLRSPGYDSSNAAFVAAGGDVFNDGCYVINDLGVRPAFNFNLESVIFTSAAAGGKSSGDVGAGSLKSVEPNSNNEWKLTLKSGHDNFKVENVSTCDGKTVNIKYSGAVAKKGEYISAIITDKNDAVKYYGNLIEFADEDSTQGVAKVTIEDKMEPTDKLYIFNEQLNGDEKTDYSSALNVITIPAAGHKYGSWTKLNATQHQRVCEHDDTHVEKANHTWDAGKETKKATEKQAGVRTYTCTVCKATKTETIPKLKPTSPKTSGTPLAKATVKNKSMTIGWNKIQGAEGYDIFFAKCNHGKKEIKCKKVKTIKGNKTFKWTKSGLKKGTAYKFYVRAYITKNGKKTYVSKTPMFHAYTGNGTKNYTNAKSVTVNKTKVTLKKGKTFKIKAKVNMVNKKKKLMPKSHAPTLRYMTSNKKVTTVNSSGKITAKGKGTCVIYVYAHNGVSKSIKVTVP